jgi:hypothetical protein
MRPTGVFRAPEANRAGMIRLVISILLLIIAVDAASKGEYLLAAARLGFGVLAGLLAYRTLPDRKWPPRGLMIGVLAGSIALWLATFFFPTL